MRTLFLVTMLLCSVRPLTTFCDEYENTAPTVVRDADGKETWQFRHRTTGEILFEGADRIQAIRANKSRLSDVNLSFESMTGIDLSESYIDRASLYKTELSGAALQRCTFSLVDFGDADLSGADLSTSYFGRSDLEGATLRGASLTSVSIYHSNLRGCDLREADLSRATLCESDLTGSDLRGALFSDAKFVKPIFEPSFPPEPESLLGATGLRSLEIANNYEPIELLRDSAYDRGLREIGAELTCAVQRNKNDSPDTLSLGQFLSFYLFDVTCAYGASPRRLFVLLGVLSFFHVVFVQLNASTTSRDGRLAIQFIGKNGNRQVVRLARVRRVLTGKKSFLWTSTLGMSVAVLVTLRTLMGRRLFEATSRALSRRPVGFVATGMLRGWAFMYALGLVYLVFLWAGTQYGRIFG